MFLRYLKIISTIILKYLPTCLIELKELSKSPDSKQINKLEYQNVS